MHTKKEDKGFLYIGSVAFAGFIMATEYYSATVCFIMNYWMYSVSFIVISVIIFFILLKKVSSLDLIFFIPFLYTVPVVSFYTLPKIIHTIDIGVIDKNNISFKAVVERVTYTYRADPPYLYAKVLDLPIMQKMKVQVEDRDFNILQSGNIITVHGSLSKICFNYEGYTY